jgi:energy-coupling factor transporter ATP-binding protein EcfA2
MNIQDTKQNGKDADLILVRGIPGSGKSTLAKMFKDRYIHIESDMYFVKNGKFEYRIGEMEDSHNWCKWWTKNLLEAGYKVVVSNTFTQKSEMSFYVNLGYKTKIIDAQGDYGDIHNIPKKFVFKLKARFQPINKIIKDIKQTNPNVSIGRL